MGKFLGSTNSQSQGQLSQSPWQCWVSTAWVYCDAARVTLGGSVGCWLARLNGRACFALICSAWPCFTSISFALLRLVSLCFDLHCLLARSLAGWLACLPACLLVRLVRLAGLLFPCFASLLLPACFEAVWLPLFACLRCFASFVQVRLARWESFTNAT